MPLNSLGSNYIPGGETDNSNPRPEHNSASLDYTNPRLAAYGVTSMISNTILEARRWTMPAMVQDLASLFRLESIPPDDADASAPTTSFDSTRLRSVRSPSQDMQPSARFGKSYAMERKVKARTRFVLAHPPPVTRSKQRLCTRPRMVLQLQRVSDNLRPLPAFDVISSTALASRFARSIPRMMRGEKISSTENLVLVRSEMYGQDSTIDGDKTDDSGDETTRRRRDCLGTICYARKANDGLINQDEICLENGLTWKAACLKAGLYEFSGKNHDGPKLRWVLRRARRPDLKRNSLTESSNKRCASRFTFSIINPTTRLHPVIATITSDNRLDILDRFPTLLSSESATPPSSNAQSPVGSELSSETSYFERPTSSEVSYTETDEALQMLIILTAIWVLSKEGSTETLSEGLDVVNKPKEGSTNRSPSALNPSTETVPQGSPLPSRKLSSRQRSSTSPGFLQRAASSQLANSLKVSSAPPSRTRTAALTVPVNNESYTFPLPPALQSCQPEAERRTFATSMDAQGQPSSLASSTSSGSTANRMDRVPLVECGETPQDLISATASHEIGKVSCCL
jgi:hypothetical protein